jgi:hypothetical protein
LFKHLTYQIMLKLCLESLARHHQSHGTSLMKSFTKNKVLRNNNRSPCKIWLGKGIVLFIYTSDLLFFPLFLQIGCQQNGEVTLPPIRDESPRFFSMKAISIRAGKKPCRYRKLTMFSQYNWLQITLNSSQFSSHFEPIVGNKILFLVPKRQKQNMNCEKPRDSIHLWQKYLLDQFFNVGIIQCKNWSDHFVIKPKSQNIRSKSFWVLHWVDCTWKTFRLG